MLERAVHTAQDAAGTGDDAVFSVAISRTDAAVLVKLGGTLDQRSVAILTPMLRDLIDGQGNAAVVVDLRGVPGVGPAAVELFTTAWSWARSHGVSFRLHRPPGPLRDLLQHASNGSEFDAAS